jgi:hypothetical protein
VRARKPRLRGGVLDDRHGHSVDDDINIVQHDFKFEYMNNLF